MPGAGRWWTSSEGTRLPAGGMLSPGKTGHSDVTRELAERFGFSSAAVAILADASQDPDFYEWGNPAAHAQTPDEVDHSGAEREALIAKAQRDYVAWIADKIDRIVRETQSGRYRHALYWVGYAMHGVEDLAPHAGRTNAEHARNHQDHQNPDDKPEHVELARSYAARFLRAVRGRLGSTAFDALRSYSRHGAFSFLAKKSQELHGHPWDFGPGAYEAYTTSGGDYVGKPVRWPREVVFQQLIEAVVGPDAAKSKLARQAMHREARAKEMAVRNAAAAPDDGFERVAPVAERKRAKWTVMVYMAGDDTNPGGIEYAVQQDLLELKTLGSSDDVHFVAQADDATTNRGHRYRLRSGTPLDTDCMAVFTGDLNTGNVGTLVDFVRWAERECPAERYALVLWGHGAGHDDQNIYRLARGKVTPRVAAHLARKRLGFFQGSRRAILDRGPQRGFGYDDTAADFLDNHELADALATIREVLGKRLDLLGFDACLMSMVEVAYEVRKHAEMFVASARPEPGDGWYYERAFAPLVEARGALDTKELACAIVNAYRDGYQDVETLAAVDLDAIDAVAASVQSLAGELAKHPGEFHWARRAAINCSPRGVDGYRDLATLAKALIESGTVVDEAQKVSDALERAVLSRCGEGGGLTIYAPGDYRPHVGGSTDETYEGLSFAREHGWSSLLRAIYRQCDPPALARRTRTKAAAPASARAGGSLYGLDRHNAHDVLGDIVDRRSDRWVDLLRRRTLSGMEREAEEVLGDIREAASDAHRRTVTHRDDRPPPRTNRDRILILPGIMGSQLQDRTGTLQLVWIDPWGLTVGSDFDSMRLRDDALMDLDPGVELIATAPLPIIYDRLALALTWAFGPIVEYAPYDWRKPIAHTAREVKERIEAIHQEGGRVALVGHSMGGLVATNAIKELGDDAKRAVTGLVAMGTPWRGSFEALRALRGEAELLRNFGVLTQRSDVELANIVQSFRGLCELIPDERPDLLQPSLFAPGPLSRLPSNAAPFRAALELYRTPPPNTVAIVSDRLSTVINAQVVDSRVVAVVGPGDGTVSTRSASNDGHGVTVVTVSERHVTLPLDGAAIRETVSNVRRWFGASKRTEDATAWELPPDLKTKPTSSREALMQRLQLEEQITLGDLAAMLPLA